MDPNACLTRVLEAIEGGDREEATAALVDLAGWIEKGGFLPRVGAVVDTTAVNGSIVTRLRLGCWRIGR